MDARYYDWDALPSNDADVTIIVGEHDLGKNYALQMRDEYCVEDTDTDSNVKTDDWQESRCFKG